MSLGSKAVICILATMSLIFVFELISVKVAFAQGEQQISISVVNSSFAPLTTFEGNQVRVSIMYRLNNESLENTRINGIMEVFSSNGSLIRSSSFPNGFVLNNSGIEVFRTTLVDPAARNVSASIKLIDLNRENTLSNTVTANMTVKESESLATTNSSAV